MIKHFPSMPPEFEQYNPGSFVEHSIAVETHDENGFLHSYDDKPSSVEFDKFSFKVLKWHSHGELKRANGKPPMISMSSNRYITFNEQELRHSYDGMPSTLYIGEFSWLATWEKNSLLHRDNDVPAEILLEVIDIAGEQVTSRRESYYLNGKRHRSNNSPADFYTSDSEYVKDYYVAGTLHNAEGPAKVFKVEAKTTEANRWYLYGVEVPEAFFQEFTQIHKRINAPAWAAFLVTLKQIEEKDLALLNKEESSWDQTFSILWLLRVLGVTESSFTQGINKFVKEKLILNLGYNAYHGDNTLLKVLVMIAHSEAEETVMARQRKELSNV